MATKLWRWIAIEIWIFEIARGLEEVSKKIIYSFC